MANDAGNTPRPSEIFNAFFLGMRTVEKDPKETKKILSKACTAAAKAASAGTAQRYDKELEAMVLMGLGYAYAVEEELKLAAKYYNKSLKGWMTIYKGLHLSMYRLMRDTATVEIMAGEKDSAMNHLRGLGSLLKKNKGSKNPDMAETVCRMAILLSEAPDVAKRQEAVTYFDKACGCVRNNPDPLYTRALVSTLQAYEKWLVEQVGLEGEASLDSGKLQEKLTAVQAELKLHE